MRTILAVLAGFDGTSKNERMVIRKNDTRSGRIERLSKKKRL